MKELIDKYVGKYVYCNLKGMKVKMKVKDVRMSYGKEQYLVTPVAGYGEVWTESLNFHVTEMIPKI